MELKLAFSSLVLTVVFQICWHTECSLLTASSFRIWNSSAGILSPLLALFIVMLPKAHLSSHSRMFGSRWVIISLWFSGSLRLFFLYSSSVYSCHLFLFSSTSFRSLTFLLSFIVPILAWNVPLISPSLLNWGTVKIPKYIPYLCESEVKVKVAQLCPTLYKPMAYIGHRILQTRILEWVAFPSPGDLPNPEIEPISPILQADSLPAGL